VILVFGKTGQVALELQNNEGVFALGRDQVDLCDHDACIAAIYENAPSVVINAAAYTSVDKAENEEDLATIINGNAPTAIAKACAELNIPFIHISSDYVFSGIGIAPWLPTHPTFPRNAYGRSKLAGEKGILSSGAIYVILRTSWIISAHGNNFVKTMLRLSESCDLVNVVKDQIGGPTPARDLAKACIRIAEQLVQDSSKLGIYHFCGSPNASWAQLSEEIFKQSGRNVTVQAITTDEYPTPAKRPLNSRMDCHTTDKTFGIKSPNWRAGLNTILTDLEVIK